MIAFMLKGYCLSFFCFILERGTDYHSKNIENKIIHLGKIFIGIFLIFTIIVGMSGNRGAGDVGAFIAFFNHIKNYVDNPWDYTYELFARVTALFLKIWPSVTFFKFRATLFLVIWLGVVLFYREYTYSFNSVLFLYLLSGIYMSEGEQLKNFVAVSFLIYGLTFMTKKGFGNLIIYYIFTVIAILFHFSFFIYLFVPIIKTSWFGRIKKNIPVLCGVIYAFLFVGGTRITSSLLRMLSYFPMMDKLNVYLMGYAGKRSLVPFSVYFVALYVIYRCKSGQFDLGEKKSWLLDMVYNVWLLMGIVLPFLIYANAAYRLFRNLYIPIMIVMSNCAVSAPRLSRKRICISGLILCFIFSVAIHPILFRQWVDTYQPLIDGDFFWR